MLDKLIDFFLIPRNLVTIPSLVWNHCSTYHILSLHSVVVILVVSSLEIIRSHPP
jgi:hypothetical protein